jgi:hypothetical protein
MALSFGKKELKRIRCEGEPGVLNNLSKHARREFGLFTRKRNAVDTVPRP